MKRVGETSMGGFREEFPTTRWTEIRGFRDAAPAEQQAIIGHLSQRYWRPVYAWLRKHGYPIEDAKELTQGFFCDIILDRRLVSRADQAKGRFRTFLLNALKAYTSDAYRREAAQKRNPTGGFVNLDSEDLLSWCPQTASPDDAFNYVWASDLLNHVIAELQAEYQKKDMQVHWEVFNDKVLQPILNGQESPSYDDLCQKYHIPDEHKAAAMTTTVKRRFRVMLKQAVKPHVESDPDVDEEISELLGIFSQTGA